MSRESRTATSEFPTLTLAQLSLAGVFPSISTHGRTPTGLSMPSPPLSIVQSLSPRIAVLTSEDVVTSCEANGCRGLEELLRPWEGATDRGELYAYER